VYYIIRRFFMIDMTAKVYGVELTEKEKIYYFSELNEDEKIKIGDYVLVNTDMGDDHGKVILGPKNMTFEEIGYEPKPIIRILNDEDWKVVEENKKNSLEVVEFTKIKSRQLGLNMRVLRAKYTYDRSKLVIYFGSDSRVDFRELVKELAKKYKVRIELRQVGIRDEVKIKGSLGLCGQMACCTRFLREFDSIKMELAKTQQMMINTAKISGRCGKLLCCLKYENDFYEEVLSKVPYENTTIEYEGKPAKVITVNVFLKEVTLQVIEDNQPILIKVEFDFFKNTETKELYKEEKKYFDDEEENNNNKNLE